MEALETYTSAVAVLSAAVLLFAAGLAPARPRKNTVRSRARRH
jgi:hypothetical protein